MKDLGVGRSKPQGAATVGPMRLGRAVHNRSMKQHSTLEQRRQQNRRRAQRWKSRGKCTRCGKSRQPHRIYCHVCAGSILFMKYGITEIDYERLLVEQGGACAICRNPSTGRRLSVDHDHDTGRVRGLLCFTCNIGLGSFKDSILRLESAIEYLIGST